ncbi:MAG: DEAD/DEAH box helicase family protein [Rickettsiales bacterium]|jgi:type I restriction enzyme R subunit|nr:DEAD/DEAH box helicase family protein [Rickettsiales bacterium]
MNYTEKDLENYAERTLLENGYVKAIDFNKQDGFNLDTLIKYIEDTQKEMWEKFKKVFGEQSKNLIKDALFRELQNKTFIEVLNGKISHNGYDFNLYTSKPYNNINPSESENYDKNIVEVLRQCKYNPYNESSLDIVLLLNGFPIITIELKNQWTGQNYENAISQYQYTRDANAPLFKFSLVHFTVDLTNVFMTTKLDGKNTKFLPFNKGKGDGIDCGAGNSGDTSYLWNDVLRKDNLLHLINEYICVKEKNIIFPRFHQLDCVRNIIKDVLKQEKIPNYLIQHSAGSGKTNTITILSGILSNLHSENEDENRNYKKVFDKIILMTDRKILDKQLTENFKIKDISIKHAEDGNGLRCLLKDNTKIISTTIQKFNTIKDVAFDINKKICIIVDEAHSSQSGRSANNINKVLSKKEESRDEKESYKTNLDKIIEELEKMKQPSNINFIAFTATPKPRTLEKFGVKTVQGFEPFHLYSMKQAIEENYILDVLQNYYEIDVKYSMKEIEQEIEVGEKTAKGEIKKAYFNDSDFIKEKCNKIIEILETNKSFYIKDRKIMIVCSSRLSAVKFYLELRNKIDKIKSLVAFTGTVEIENKSYTEQSLNGFEGDDKIKGELGENYDVLIVANKFQVGFDMPQLQIMFLDKQIGGVNAIQTLSRLNRTYKDKENVFIYDFVNKAEKIGKDFEKYYKKTNLSGESNFSDLYNLQDKILEKTDENEIEKINCIIYNNKLNKDEKIQEINKTINLEKLRKLPIEEQKSFKSLLRKFNNFYIYYLGIPNNKLNIDEKLLNEESKIIKLHKMYNWNTCILKLFFIQDENKDWISLLASDIIVFVEPEKKQVVLGAGRDVTIEPPKPPKPQELIKELLNNIIKKFNSQYDITEDDADSIMENTRKEASESDRKNSLANISKKLRNFIEVEIHRRLENNGILKIGNENDLKEFTKLITDNFHEYNNLKEQL